MSSVEETYEFVKNGSVAKRGWLPLVALMAAGALALVAVVLAVDRVGENTEDAERGPELARAIQDERARSIRADCKAQNERHHEAVAALNGFFAGRPTDDPQAARDFTRTLADALVPVQNCGKLVRESVKEGHK